MPTSSSPASSPSSSCLPLHWQILIAIALAVVLGAYTGTDMALLGVSFYSAYDFVGSLFLNALKMLIVPLVMSSIIVGVAGLGTGSNVGRLGGKTLGFYALSSLFSILMGLLWVNLMSPGLIDGLPAGEQLHLGTSDPLVASKLEKIEGRGAGDVMDVFLRMVPSNVVDAAAKGQMLGMIFFSMLFGFFMTRISDGPAQTLKSFWQGVSEVMVAMTMLVMKFAPIGVFGLVAKTIASTGFGVFQPLLLFFFTVLLALAGHVFISLTLALKAVGVNPVRHYRAMVPALLTAFSTASSSGTLPLTMDCVEKKSGVSKQTTSFILPLGATINMDGTALYECVAAMFIAQAYGLDLTLSTQFTIVLVALLTSIGVAGIPSASLVAITVILAAIGLPLEGIGLLMVTDRILDMLRTAVNVFSDSVCAVVVARTEGEKNVLQG